MKELKVIDSELISHCDYTHMEPPEFEYKGRNCPESMPDSLPAEFRDFLKEREGDEKFYAFVLRKKVVKAVEITSMEDLTSVEGPYFGLRTISFFDAQDEANGLGAYSGAT